ncbi:uncharacterized protein A1O9_10842 [Exophiala aquamarina CBS 119918]|uniref:Elongator complex protein 4 n=1 Tax=Exophiala aquamarina CBS 119918 TaxID=1182545 RepID=A0A072NZA4_9EURO|nr:uncharacterized protein A1O9_10842 [Exophiala aquamarina CBS 119918]KEF52936.1 hypothetical protein A1O9_10842 [Exophiala aquamarina CBS 119918]
MSFRKRNVGLSGTAKSDTDPSTSLREKHTFPGVRPSPIDGRPATSTGTASLDTLLAGHSGLVLGSSLLIEESGTTDYSGALLRFYAAEGLLQGHHVHVIALPEQWGRALPGVVRDSEKRDKAGSSESVEKMKIAWRYESLGQFGAGSYTREIPQPRSTQPNQPGNDDTDPGLFCHAFDLTKRLIHPAAAKLDFLQLSANPRESPFGPVLSRLAGTIANSSPDTVHRVIIPSLLSPALYPPHSSSPQFVLQFFHGIRAILATSPQRVTAISSLPLSLYPRSSGLVRWIELLHDGVLELSPFPHSAEADIQPARGSGGPIEEQPQGLLQVHRVPVLQERGSGNATSENDWTFTLSRRKFTIKPFNLPPIEGDTEAQQVSGLDSKAKKSDVEF